MKKYKYRLETLLKVKSQKEKEKQREHAEALRKVYEQKERLTQIDSRRRDNLGRQRQVQEGGKFSVVDMLFYTRYFLKLKRETLAGGELLRGLQRKSEEKRQALVRAAKERKIYEKLKEKQKKKYDDEMETAEKKELDEIATNSFYFNRRK
ncbi:MAG: flagellar export protein FliJ [candidate division Zixibacteria bacterium]|nr:flagellar export protein FliJ [candidate division Zixibacteria bacterium]